MTRGRATGRVVLQRLPAAGPAVLAAAVLLTGCSGGGNPLATASPSPTATSASTTSVSPSPSPTGSPSAASASPATASPATAVPTGTASPGTASPSPSSSGVQVTCSSVTVTGLGRTTVGPLRTTDVATVVSDGRNLTPGTRQQTDFTPPVLTAPGGGTISDPGTVQQVANLLVGQKHRVLSQRPPAPDESTDPAKRPFNSPGTYAVYNASSLLTAEAVVQCAGQQQTWTFTAEADPATGQINCAVEPARSNALAKSVFAQSC
jgi:hypothetical protein